MKKKFYNLGPSLTAEMKYGQLQEFQRIHAECSVRTCTCQCLSLTGPCVLMAVINSTKFYRNKGVIKRSHVCQTTILHFVLKVRFENQNFSVSLAKYFED